MDVNVGAYLVFGIILVITFAGIILYYYSRNRKTKVEEPKFRMLDDD